MLEDPVVLLWDIRSEQTCSCRFISNNKSFFAATTIFAHMSIIFIALTNLPMVDMIENLANVMEKRTHNCFSISAIPSSLCVQCFHLVNGEFRQIWWKWPECPGGALDRVLVKVNQVTHFYSPSSVMQRLWIWWCHHWWDDDDDGRNCFTLQEAKVTAPTAFLRSPKDCSIIFFIIITSPIIIYIFVDHF